MRRRLIGQIVRHFKGNLYLVLGEAENTETGEMMIFYKALYGKGKVWCRPKKMFMERVPNNKKNPTGQWYRFKKYKPTDKVEYEIGD